MAGMGDGSVGTAQDGVRIRRLEKQREAERRKLEELKSKAASVQDQAGLLQFGAGTSEVSGIDTRHMSLSLLQGYSSAEEEQEPASDDLSSSSEEVDHLDSKQSQPLHEHSSSFLNAPPKSHLPSATDAFSQISAPPQFLNNFVGNQSSIDVIDSAAFRGRRKSKDRKDLPPGVVVEAKAQLVGTHERVRSDIDPPPSSDQTKLEPAKSLVMATYPDAKDASELLRMCLQCGIPKTYSNARGMVCPECSDHSLTEEPTKKRGSAVKDKEKNKRMKGQSSHATWKSETEMQLRQQFD